MKKRINIFTKGGHHFTFEYCENDGQNDLNNLTDSQIFEELLTGKEELVQVKRMCFIRRNLTAVVIEDVTEGLSVLPESNGNGGQSDKPTSREQLGWGHD
ncbi:MAG TPA: hypothetical protein VKZ95_04380 [Sphingobacteriaceae bacterium]|nr:hypothetical protein [Sphingobacteriaceae bacterium]